MTPPQLNQYAIGAAAGLLWLAAAGGWSAAQAAQPQRPPYHTYYIEEPVFDGRAYVREAGREHPKTLLLVHGLGPNGGQIWAPHIPALAEQYHVIAVDLPGFGRSSKDNQLYSPANYARFLDFVIERLANTPYMLVAHSMGGNVAIDYSVTHPRRFARLMLVDVAGVLHRFAYSQYLTHFGIELIPEFYPEQNNDLRNLAEDMLESLSLNSQWMSRAERMILQNPTLRQTVLQGEPNTIAGYAMAMADYSDTLEKIRQPTLIVWGEDDKVTPMRTAHVLARRIPRAALVTVADAGHSPMSDQPRGFRTWVRRFADASAERVTAILDEHAYRLPGGAPQAQTYHCQDRSGLTLQGDYATITIEACTDVTLNNVTARRITVADSVVHMDNCHLQSTQTALRTHRSQVTMTACRIEGQPALELQDSELDIAGSHIKGGDYAIDAPAGAPPSRLLFSVSHVESRYIDKALHGPVVLGGGEGM